MSASLKTIAFFAPDLSGGGAERVMVEFIRHLDRSRFRPVIIVCRCGGPLLDLIPDDTAVYSLGKTHPLDLPALVFRYRRRVRELAPDVVLSFLWYADAIQLIAKPRGVKAVCSIHTVPSEIAREPFGAIKLALLQRLYRRADAVLTVSEAIACEFRTCFGLRDANRVRVQPNPFPFATIRAQAAARPPDSDGDRTQLVAVGRLSEVKGFDDLLDAVAALPADLDWQLRIVGDGPLRQALETHAQALGIGNQVRFEGFKLNPYPYIASADILILASHFEAYPSVLIEALALGTAVVAVDCPTGPREILAETTGILVPPGERRALTAAIERLATDDVTRRRFAQAGPDAVASLDAGPATRQLEQKLAEILA